MKVIFVLCFLVVNIFSSTSGKTKSINKENDLYCLDPFTGDLHPVGSTWPSTAFCGNFSCRAKLVPKKGGHDTIPELQEDRVKEEETESDTETNKDSGRDDSETNETGINSFLRKHCEDGGFEEIDEACDALVQEAEDPEIKSDIKRLVELYKASKELTKTLEDTEKEFVTTDKEFDKLRLNMNDEIEDKTANNFEHFSPLEDYYLSPELVNKTFESIYKEYNEYLKKYYAFYPEYRNELGRLLVEDDIDVQNNCIRFCDDDAEASASENDECEICALESQNDFDYQSPEIETRIQTEVKPKPQTYPGYFFDEESNSYVYHYGPNQPYVDLRFGFHDEVTPVDENPADESQEYDDEASGNHDNKEVEEGIYHSQITPESEEPIPEVEGIAEDVNKSKDKQGDMSVSYYKYDKAKGKYVLKVPKDEEEYEKFRQEYIKVYNLSDSNSNEHFEDINAYQEYFRANFAEHVNDTEANKTDSYGTASTRKVIMLNHNGENINIHHTPESTQNNLYSNVPTFEYKLFQANQDEQQDLPKPDSCPHGHQILPSQENFYHGGQNCLAKQESCYQHEENEAHAHTNWYQEEPKDLTKPEEFDDIVELLKPSPAVQTPKLNRFERLNDFLKSRSADDGNVIMGDDSEGFRNKLFYPKIGLPKLRKLRPISPIVPSLLRNKRSTKPDVKSIDDDVNGEEWETFITVEGCPETLEPGKFKMGDPDKLFPECCPQKIDS